MQARVKWVENALMIGESGSGHVVPMDGPEAFGGRNLGIRPMEMLLLGLGGCTEFDVVSILQKKRQPFTAVEVEISAERATEHPKVYTQIHLHFKVYGKGVDPKAVGRAVELSAEKYCSASAMLAAVAKVTHDHEVIDID